MEPARENTENGCVVLRECNDGTVNEIFWPAQKDECSLLRHLACRDIASKAIERLAKLRPGSSKEPPFFAERRVSVLIALGLHVIDYMLHEVRELRACSSFAQSMEIDYESRISMPSAPPSRCDQACDGVSG
jgi:hypothetical protein